MIPRVSIEECAIRWWRMVSVTTWAAVSTHDGEEKAAAGVHKLLRPRHAGLLTIIVPRHPERADALEAGCEEEELSAYLALAEGSAKRKVGERIQIVIPAKAGIQAFCLFLNAG